VLARCKVNARAILREARRISTFATERGTGSKWFTSGDVAASNGRIQFDFMFEGIRYRPSIQRPPSEANLRRARERLADIKRQIELGTFSFAEEFPDYRFLHRVTGASRIRSCNEVFNEFLAHCEARRARGDLAAATLSTYRRVLESAWRPELGKLLFHQVRFARLVTIADAKLWSKKTYNNAISILRQAFDSTRAPRRRAVRRYLRAGNESLNPGGLSPLRTGHAKTGGERDSNFPEGQARSVAY